MNCPECSTWNPDDKLRCWRCNATLPTPEPPKKKRRINPQVWMWVGFVLLLVLSTLVRCALSSGIDSEGVGWLVSSIL